MLTCSLGCRYWYSPLAALVAEDFERAVAHHLVGVHVGGSACAALDHVDHELLVQGAAADLLAGRHDGVAQLGRQQAEFGIGLRRRFLDGSQRDHQLGEGRDGGARDLEVLLRA
jgi:hypothetical protein